MKDQFYRFFPLLFWSALSLGLSQNPAHGFGEAKPPIQKILTEQAKAWNAGDIERFMEHYWKSDHLTFSSGGKITRGWSATLANYKKRYPNREKMGKLTFTDLEITPLGKESALVLGKWHLDRKTDQLGGNFTLIFRRLQGRWVIVHDHTSRLEK